MNNEHRAASDVLHDVVNEHREDTITLAQLKEALHERGFGFLMLIFSLPMTFPAIPPGMTAILAIPLAFLSVQMLIGRSSPWLPTWLGSKKMKRTTLAMVVVKTSPYLKKIERLLKQRFSFTDSKKGEKIVGLFCLICAISIANPLPATNMVPAIGIALMSLGLLSKDGVMVIAGMIVGMGGVAFGVYVTILAYVGLSMGVDLVK